MYSIVGTLVYVESRSASLCPGNLTSNKRSSYKLCFCCAKHVTSTPDAKGKEEQGISVLSQQRENSNSGNTQGRSEII